MEQSLTAAPERIATAALDESTLCAAFQRLVAESGDRAALRTLDGSVDLTWSQLGARVRRAAAALAALGLRHGDTVALLLPNVPECHVLDYAAMHLGAVPYTIYNSSSDEQIAHQLRNADTRVVFAWRDLLPAVMRAQREAPDLARVVAIDDGGLDEILADADPGFNFDGTWRSVTADDLVTVIYTSGTTGPPKGAQWTHRMVMAQLRAMDAALPLPTEAVVSFLPMAHAGGRLTAHYMALAYGATITTCPDLKELPAHLAAVRPDALFAVPRLWEKLRVGVEAAVSNLDGALGETAARAIEVGVRRVRAVDAAGGGPGDDGRSLADEHAESLVDVAPLLRRLGLDRIKAAYVGGAPCAPDLVRFFRACGVPLLEAYGLTEGGLNVFNRIETFKTGTAGLPLPGVEMRQEPDGELLFRSELNFVGYRKEPEKTAEALDADGWLHTGDIGEVDDEGFVKIIDRKKEIIINAAGKNMSPANIESAIKDESWLIGQVVCIGDGRRYNTALITLDPEAAPVHAKRLGVEGASFDELAAAAGIQAEISRAVQAGNARLSRVEQVKRFKVLGSAWRADSDELTPTLKLKRKSIARKYAAEIDELYAE